ncbi:zinc-binding dehydrogenase [Actinokineospora sp. HUAS TT18]|uniref:zinc-binding dehydrogenase n=1 Tax=Actinokineospora sp. HUAS TT18 TaxID=3447451 RepID=UPI003F523223
MRSLHLLARPTGLPTASQFGVVETELPELAEGTALVENSYLSVDPYMRELMDDGWEIGEQCGLGRAVGRVVASREPAWPEGALVSHGGGWSTHAVLTAGQPGARVLREHDGVPVSAYLSVLGGTGLTAYIGLTEVLRLQPGESIFISAAAGAVGGTAGQIARLLGAGQVIGSTGSAAKVKHVVDALGFDAAVDYHDGPLIDQLRAVAPEGVHTSLDGVGGDHLAAAIAITREFGRIAWVGAISQYNDAENPPAAPRNLYRIADSSIRLAGYQVRHHLHLREQAEALLVPNIQSGRIRVDETIVDGFVHVVDAFIGVLRGENVGKMLVRL